MSPVITGVRTVVVDLPSRRPHRFASHEIDTQAYLVVAITVDGEVTGVGEGVSPGGPWWGGESIEGQQALIEHHVAPLIVGRPLQPIRQLMADVDRAVFANPFAKAAVEMALHDALGRLMGVPAHLLLGGGGAQRDRFPVRWALSAAAAEEVLAECEEVVAAGHTALKFKMGALPPADDLVRMARIVEGLPGHLSLLVDPNGTWDRRTAVRSVLALEEMGVDVVEQPIERRDLDGMADLVRRATRIAIMADEGVCAPADALAAVEARACDSIAVKVGKAGGLARARDVATIAHTAGCRVYGGTHLESSLGTAANLQLLAALPTPADGTELVGPLLLADDLTVERLEYVDGDVLVPAGPGLGVDVDWDKVAKYARTPPGDVLA